ncbi:MAG: hypothetical protein A2020_01220 [Lentisphaerae bacterium GWF2_45_14]|nr:MAG: hypothetical protein A2020_01220 [Lentisphaerae bacterium GWF2_45_14]
MNVPGKTSYLNVICSKCGRKIRTKQSEFSEGFSCPKCFAMVVDRPDASASSALVQEVEAMRVFDGLGPREICPACEAPVNIEFEKKYLARCAACFKFFIRKKASSVPAETEKKDTLPTPGNAVMPPTAEQLAILESLNIAGMPLSIFEASDVILTVTSIAEGAFKEFFSSFSLLPLSLKTAIVRKFILSDTFPRLYLSGEKLKYEELLPFIEANIGDQDIRDAVKKYIADDNMNSAIDYVDGFSNFVYDKKLDPDIIRTFALKAFARGFGTRLQANPASLLTYDSDGVLRRNAVSALPPEKLFTKHSSANSGLLKIFEECVGSPPEISRRCASGCFIMLPLTLLPMAVYLFRLML